MMISSWDITHSTVTIANNTVLSIWKLLREQILKVLFIYNSLYEQAKEEKSHDINRCRKSIWFFKFDDSHLWEMTLRKLGIEVNDFSTYKEYLQKNPETNIKLNGKKKRWWYPSKIKNKARMSSLTTLIQHSSEAYSQLNEVGEIKDIQIRKEES